MYTKLLIVGNGFDISHGLNTSVTDFGNSFTEIAEPFFNDVNAENSYPFDDYRSFLRFVNDVYLEPFCKEFWKDFEVNLSRVQWEKVAALGMPEDVLQVRLNVLQIVVRRAFFRWILSVNEGLPTSTQGQLFDDTCAINFNYTETLEKLYNAKCVLHLHGVLKNEKSIIYGHSSAARRKPRRKEYWNVFEYVKDLYLFATDKHVQRRIHRLGTDDRNFVNWRDIKTVVVLGHSMNEIDMPYLCYFNRKIYRDTKPGAEWYVFCYGANDEKNASLLKKRLKGEYKGFYIEKDYSTCANICIKSFPSHREKKSALLSTKID